MSQDITIVRANEMFPELGHNAHYVEVYDHIKKVGLNGRKNVIDVYAENETEMVERTAHYGIITVNNKFRTNPMIGFTE
tara:strand:+ start:401 stop:637 length:237 start_codon:yes stop_codon:yes gene_type:complete